MKLLDQFIAQTAKKPAEWTSQDIQHYLNYVEKRMSAGSCKNRSQYAHTAVRQRETSVKRDNVPDASCENNKN